MSKSKQNTVSKHEKRRGRKEKETRTIVIRANKGRFPEPKQGHPALRLGTHKVMRTINRHFKTDAWPLDFGLLVTDVFYEAFGYNLENHLLAALFRSGKYELMSDEGRLLITQVKGARRGRKNKKG